MSGRVRALLAQLPDAQGRGALLRWVLAPALAGALVSSVTDVTALPFIGRPAFAAVVLVDGQAYFGRLEDRAGSDTVVIADAYYLQEARTAGTDVPVAVVKRGSELHVPVPEMRIRREKVLLVERVGADSPVAQAIAAQRTFDAGIAR